MLIFVSDFLGYFLRENGRGHHAAMRAPNSLEPPNPTKKLTPCTGQLKSQTHVFEISRPGAPTPFKILM